MAEFGLLANWEFYFPTLDLSGPPEAKARTLLEHWDRLQCRGHGDDGTPNERQVRLMALELLHAHPETPVGELPAPVTGLMATVLGFTPEDLQDAEPIYRGAHHPKQYRSRSQAQWIEAEHLARTGKWPSIRSVAEKVGVSRSTVRDRWRADPEYMEDIELLAQAIRKNEPSM